ncbi:hypothetical protein FRC12_016710 [Ceratobasidium sp. 428]|nr:hypothetical protein FRC12_016710 [Ceratobasidium sp. 428]
MAIPVIAVTSMATLVYVLATILPAIDRFCPYSTPVIPVFVDTVTLLAAALRKAMLEIVNASRKPGHVANAFKAIVFASLVSQFVSLVRSIISALTIHYELSDAYSGSTKVPMDLVTSQMLAWLIANCENSRSVDIALQAISGADDDLPGEPLVECGALKLALLRLEACIKLGSTSSAALQYYRASGVLVSGSMAQATEDRWSAYSHTIQTYEGGNSYRSLHSDDYDNCKTYCSYAYLVDRFGSTADLNTRATIAITAMPFFHWNNGVYTPEYMKQERILEITTAVLQQHLQAESSGLSTVVLTAIAKSSVHYLVGLRPEELEEHRPGPSSVLIILLSRVFFMSYGAAPDTARAVAITLAAAAFAAHTYPGGEEPQVSRYARENRAINVYNYYHAQEFLTTEMVLELFIFGFFGLLPDVDFNDENTRAVATPDNFRQLLRHVPQLDLFRHPSIHTLPRYPYGKSLNDTIFKPSSQFMISFTNDASSSCEIGLAYNCLPLLIHQSERYGNNFRAKLYIPTLIALCRAESVEVQDLCLQFIDAQPTPQWPLNLLESAEDRDSLNQLCRTLIDCRTRTPVASIAALHFELLVARIITYLVSDRSETSNGQSALRPLLNLQGQFAGRIIQHRQLDVEALLSGLGECCKEHLNAEEHIVHTMQSITDFCGLTEAVSTPPDKEKDLRSLKDQLKPSSDRVVRQSRAEPGSSLASDVSPKLELPNSSANTSL